jgi:hypothetical protein
LLRCKSLKKRILGVEAVRLGFQECHWAGQVGDALSFRHELRGAGGDPGKTLHQVRAASVSNAEGEDSVILLVFTGQIDDRPFISHLAIGQEEDVPRTVRCMRRFENGFEGGIEFRAAEIRLQRTDVLNGSMRFLGVGEQLAVHHLET